MILINYNLRKYSRGYRFTRSQEKVNHLIYMDDTYRLQKSKRTRDTNTKKKGIYRQEIEMEFAIEKCSILLINKAKNGGNGTA